MTGVPSLCSEEGMTFLLKTQDPREDPEHTGLAEHPQVYHVSSHVLHSIRMLQDNLLVHQASHKNAEVNLFLRVFIFVCHIRH